MKTRRTREVRTFSSDEKLVSERREGIAKKAVELFLEKGYEKTTMRDIGKACGLSAGSLYHYIGSKADILHLIYANAGIGAETLRRIQSSLGDASHTRVLSECMVWYLQNCDSRRELLVFFNREIHKFSREDRNVLLSSEADIVSFFEQLLREGVEAGEFQVSKPILIAHNILMCGHDWALRKWFLKQHFTLEEYTEEQIRLVLELVEAKTSRTAKIPQAESAARLSSNTSSGA